MKRTFLRGGVAAVPLLLAGLLLAQDPVKPKPTGGKPPVEEEEAPKDGQKKPPKDDEETAPTKPKKPIPREDDTAPAKPTKPIPRDTDTPKTPAKPAAPPGKIDLAEEASRATHPDVKKLFQSVVTVADWLQLRKNTDLIQVEPIPQYIGPRTNNMQVAYRPLDPDGKVGVASYTANPGEIIKGIAYEERAIESVANFLVDMQRYPAGNAKYLPPVETLAVADKVLTAIHKFHESARSGDKRKGPGWDAVRGHLMAKYLEVLADELKANIGNTTDRGAPDKAAEIASRLGELFPDSLQAQREIQMWKLSLVNNDLMVNDAPYFDAARALQQLTVKFDNADPKVLEPLRDKLKRRAQAHFDEAKRLKETEDGKPAALRQAEMAYRIWAELPGLRDFQQQLGRDFRMLVVGVKQLPELMSPALAVTDADRWACELLFESLVKPVPDGQVGQRYVAGLAARLPKSIAMGREFELPKNAAWVDQDGTASKLDSGDVRGTLVMLQDRDNRKLRVAENIDLLSEPLVRDPFRFPLRLERGCLDPLAVMSFKILPANRLAGKPDKMLNRDFALNPIGSGPFVYHGRKTEDGREYAVFKANPNYSKRDGKFGLPRLQEVRFTVAPPDPVADLRDGRIHLLLDVPTAEMMRLREPKNELAMTTADVTLASRRIWMLAVNHRNPDLGQDAGRSLRRAIAFAINRDEILKAFKAGTTNHQVLNGPFPNDTWAVPSANPPRPLYRPEYASSEAAKAKKPDKLTLKFVADPQAQAACALIKTQAAAAGINIELAPLGVADFHRSVMVEHDYELAYVPYDYGNEAFSLRGLFDAEAVGRGERNFLGYQPDAKIGQLLTKIAATRNFERIRSDMNLLYTSFEDQMPFIPLWTLNFHAVINQSLQTVPSAAELDPLTIFDMVEEWRLNR